MSTQTKILVVDDSPDFQLLVKTLVNGEDFQIISASDTLQATRSAVREKPALIIVDIGLPGGDGWMLLDRLKSNSNTLDIPTIVVTGQSKPGLAEKSQSKGATIFLNKPIDKSTFLTTIRQLLAEPTPGAKSAGQSRRS